MLEATIVKWSEGMWSPIVQPAASTYQELLWFDSTLLFYPGIVVKAISLA